jgi:hypothetical protein
MSDWIKCSDRLPEIVWAVDGSVNSVLVLHKHDSIECGSLIQVANTVWVHKSFSCISHWAPLPELPIEQS